MKPIHKRLVSAVTAAAIAIGAVFLPAFPGLPGNFTQSAGAVTLTASSNTITAEVGAGTAGRVPITVTAPANAGVILTAPAGMTFADDPALYDSNTNTQTWIAYQNNSNGFSYTVPPGQTVTVYAGTGADVARNYTVTAHFPETSVYDVYTAAQLRTALETPIFGRTINIMNDIDAGNWTPVSLVSAAQGDFTLNGNGYVVRYRTDTTTAAALIETIQEGNAYINRLGIIADVQSKTSGTAIAGGLFGTVMNTSELTSRVTVEECFVSGSVTSISENGGATAGGFVGRVLGGAVATFTRSYVCADIISVSASPTSPNGVYGGGFVGYSAGAEDINGNPVISVNLTDCYSAGIVAATGLVQPTFAGGLIGDGDVGVMRSFRAAEVIAESLMGSGSVHPAGTEITSAGLRALSLGHSLRVAGMENPPGGINGGFPVLRIFHYARKISVERNKYTFAHNLSNAQIFSGTVTGSMAGTWDSLTYAPGSTANISAASHGFTGNQETFSFAASFRPVAGLSAPNFTFRTSSAGGLRVAAIAAVTANQPTVTVTTSGLDGLRVGQYVSGGQVLFTLNNGSYAAASVMFGTDFSFTGLPPGLSVIALDRISSTVVRATVAGTPTAFSATPYALNLPASIPVRNFTGMAGITAVPVAGNPTVSVTRKGEGAAVTNGSLTLQTATTTTLRLSAATLVANNTLQTVEYALSATNSIPNQGWQSSTNFTGLTPGTTYYAFARSAENANYSAGTPRVIPAATLASTAEASLNASSAAINFGTVAAGYSQPASQTVVIRNTGRTTLRLNPVAAQSRWTVTPGSSWNVALVPGAEVSLNIRPGTGFAPGVHEIVITVTGEDGNGLQTSVNITASITVTHAPVTLTPANPSANVEVGGGANGRAAFTVQGPATLRSSGGGMLSGLNDPALFDGSGRMLMVGSSAPWHFTYNVPEGTHMFFAGTRSNVAGGYTITAEYPSNNPVLSVAPIVARAGEAFELPVMLTQNPGINGLQLNITLSEGLEWDSNNNEELINSRAIPYRPYTTYLHSVFGGNPPTHSMLNDSFVRIDFPAERNAVTGHLITLRLRVKAGADDGIQTVTIASGSGNNTRFATVTGQVETYFLHGDVNDDGIVGENDINLLKRYLAGFDTQTLGAGTDMDGDGVIGDADLLLLMQAVKGYAPSANPPNGNEPVLRVGNAIAVQGGAGVAVPILLENNPGIAYMRLNITLGGVGLVWDIDKSKPSELPFIGGGILPLHENISSLSDSDARVAKSLFFPWYQDSRETGELLVLFLRADDGAELGDYTVMAELVFCVNESGVPLMRDTLAFTGTVTVVCGCGVCDNCNPLPICGVEVPHSLGDWQRLPSISCLLPGAEAQSCGVCGFESFREVPPATAHAWGEWEILALPTTDLPGMRVRYCAGCFAEPEIGIIPQIAVVCLLCDERWEDCECFCPRCGIHLSFCECPPYCPDCFYPDWDCRCDCPECGAEWGECDCVFCEICGLYEDYCRCRCQGCARLLVNCNCFCEVCGTIRDDCRCRCHICARYGSDCDCVFCEFCGEYYEDCDCECPDCGESPADCVCYCRECLFLVENCVCVRPCAACGYAAVCRDCWYADCGNCGECKTCELAPEFCARCLLPADEYCECPPFCPDCLNPLDDCDCPPCVCGICRGCWYRECGECGVCKNCEFPPDFCPTCELIADFCDCCDCGDCEKCGCSRLPGDVSGTGRVDIGDALAVLQYVLGAPSAVDELDEETRLIICDFNGDGIIDMSDALAVLIEAIS